MLILWQVSNFWLVYKKDVHKYSPMEIMSEGKNFTFELSTKDFLPFYLIKTTSESIQIKRYLSVYMYIEDRFGVRTHINMSM